MRCLDLSHDIADGTPAYRGLPPARLSPLVTRERSREVDEGQSEFLEGTRCIEVDMMPILSDDIRCVLFQTHWDRYWNSPEYYRDAPFLDMQTAEALVQSGVSVVGIDSPNIDDMDDLSCPVHSQLLIAGIPIVEHLCHLQEVEPLYFVFLR